MSSLAISPPDPSQLELLRRQMAAPQQAPPDLAINLPQGGPAPLGSPQQPKINAPRGTLQGDQAKLSETLGSKPALENVYHSITNSSFGQNHPLLGKVAGTLAQIPATALDTAASGLAPRYASFVPGTSAHHGAEVSNLQGEVSQDAATNEKQAQTAELNSMPALHLAQLQNAQNKQNEVEEHHKQQINSQLHDHGYKQDDEGNIVPLPYEEMSESQQGVHDLKASQEELADARKQLVDAQKNNMPTQMALAQKRVEGAMQARSVALKRLNLSEEQFEMRAHGTQGGQPLPGAMLDDQGAPVGTALQQNVRPTGHQRNKADMATSAERQISDMESIVAKRPDIFGPAAGRKTDFTVWVGSQDPDAQRFRAARTIAGDHLAGTFGGRSEAALAALDNAIGQFKDNPEAVMAGLDQLKSANRLFKEKGTVKTVGSNAAASEETQTYQGHQYKKGADGQWHLQP